MILAGYLTSHQLGVSEPDVTVSAGVPANNTESTDYQRSTVTHLSAKIAPPAGVVVHSVQANNSVERSIVESDSAINIGDYLDPDEPYAAGRIVHEQINLGSPVEVYPPAYQDGHGVSRNLGVPIDVDCLDCVFADVPGEYRSIGPELSLEEYYQAGALSGGEPQHIGPDIDIESYLADQ
jgi:hypothetical protein